MSLCYVPWTAHAVGCDDTIKYDGQGAGQVIFDESLHTAKGLKCADCHEGRFLSFAIFEMKKGAGITTMKRMELGDRKSVV